MERAGEIMALCNERDWKAIVGIDPDKPEDISEIERLMNQSKRHRFPAAMNHAFAVLARSIKNAVELHSCLGKWPTGGT